VTDDDGWTDTIQIGRGSKPLPYTDELWAAAVAAAKAGLYVRYESAGPAPLYFDCRPGKPFLNYGEPE
jgi:hypothetical protein